jgi:hypothetical protein
MTDRGGSPRGRDRAWDPRRRVRTETERDRRPGRTGHGRRVCTVVVLVPGLARGRRRSLTGSGTIGTVAFSIVSVFAIARALAGWVVRTRVAGPAGAALLRPSIVAAVLGFFVLAGRRPARGGVVVSMPASGSAPPRVANGRPLSPTRAGWLWDPAEPVSATAED